MGLKSENNLTDLSNMPRAREVLGVTGCILRFCHSNYNPANGNYFFSSFASIAPTFNATTVNALTRLRLKSPLNGSIKSFRLNRAFSTGSNESVTLAIRNFTTGVEYRINLDYNAVSSDGNTYYNSNIIVSKDDEIEVYVVFPVMVTPPTAVTEVIDLYLTSGI